MSLGSLESLFTGVFLLDVYFGLKIGGQKLLISRNMIQERHLEELNKYKIMIKYIKLKSNLLIGTFGGQKYNL